MSASAPHPPDPLEQAHLLYMRGDLAGACDRQKGAAELFTSTEHEHAIRH